MLDTDTLNQKFEGETAEGILRWVFDSFDPGRVALSTSFGAEGIVLIHMLVHMGTLPRIFTIDTGRQFQQTYDVWNEVVKRYGVKIEVYGPDPVELDALVSKKGPNLFLESIDDRKACCDVRKVQPLKKALRDTAVWITALRREQSESRRDLPHLDFSNQHQLYKVYPLATWLEENVWAYTRNNGLPYNRLYDEGYLTIGCAPCTRPVRPAEGIRAARWWWEKDTQKECGIHIENGQVVRKNRAPDFQI